MLWHRCWCWHRNWNCNTDVVIMLWWWYWQQCHNTNTSSDISAGSDAMMHMLGHWCHNYVDTTNEAMTLALSHVTNTNNNAMTSTWAITWCQCCNETVMQTLAIILTPWCKLCCHDAGNYTIMQTAADIPWWQWQEQHHNGDTDGKTMILMPAMLLWLWWQQLCFIANSSNKAVKKWCSFADPGCNAVTMMSWSWYHCW